MGSAANVSQIRGLLPATFGLIIDIGPGLGRDASAPLMMAFPIKENPNWNHIR